MKKFTKFISHRPKFVLLIMTALIIPSLIAYKLTGVNYDILSYLPKDLNSTKGQEILDKDFKNAATGMLILEGTDHDAEVLREKILEVDGVEDVISKSSTLGDMIPQEFLPDDIKDIFYSKDSTLMIVKFSDSSSSIKTMNAIDKIKKIESKQKYLSGISALVKDTKDLIDKETPLYVGLAVALGLIILSLTNESTIVPFVFILTIAYAVIYNFGTNIFLGEISYLTKAIAAVLQLAVTMDYSIFLYHRYVEEKKYCKNKNDAMDIAIQKTISSLFASSLTTFAGFIVLIAMRLGLGKDIGLVMSKGVLIGLLSTIIVLPAMLLVVEKFINKYNHKVLLPEFNKLSEFTINHKKALFAIFIVLFIPAIYGSSHTKLYYNLDRSLPQDLDSIVALNKMKKDYDMASTHFILVKDDLSKSSLDNLISDLKEIDGINSVLSVSSVTGVSLPIDFLPNKLQENFSKGGYQMIMANSKYQTASPEVKNQIKNMRNVINKYDKKGLLTGEAVLTDDLTVISERDFKIVNAISIGVVFLIIAIVFKSIGIPIVLIGAIELAIQINMGIPFYLNHTIPFITSIIIGVIQLGSTIDYSILMTDRFLVEYKQLKDVDKSLKISVKETSKSIVASALSFMAATIGVGMYSKMEIVSTICIFLARGAIISMLVILVLLPAIISISFPLIKNTTKSLKVKEKKNE
ncbi:MMPL family transporter [Peptoniphilus lacrimalis]|uniref:efflux RND transporter permease subunit n=1 Tax=Peptoniphilus lacrimalis TaxID=33031 RepID=UPI002550C6C5|nr:MMPL family transporter [Peptoniphilus lacrimalis]MDK7722388.1 MMPL family transporter [Peptoniphilus lacrimalis]MDK7731990.1 MMPL family transporter [Peptoniphilus lacrimalis]